MANFYENIADLKSLVTQYFKIFSFSRIFYFFVFDLLLEDIPSLSTIFSGSSQNTLLLYRSTIVFIFSPYMWTSDSPMYSNNRSIEGKFNTHTSDCFFSANYTHDCTNLTENWPNGGRKF